MVSINKFKVSKTIFHSFSVFNSLWSSEVVLVYDIININLGQYGGGVHPFDVWWQFNGKGSNCCINVMFDYNFNVKSSNCLSLKYIKNEWIQYYSRDHFAHAPRQWETLHCSIISHWLGTYTKWSLLQPHFSGTNELILQWKFHMGVFLSRSAS